MALYPTHPSHIPLTSLTSLSHLSYPPQAIEDDVLPAAFRTNAP